MRPYFLLIFTAVILAFFTGRYVLKFQLPEATSSADIQEISRIKLEFQQTVTPYAIVNFSSLYYNDDQLELLNPALIVDNDTSDYLASNKDCQNLPAISTLLTISKDMIWEHFRCGNISELPFWFFQKSPYMHKSGSSYAYLYYRYRKLSKAEIEWRDLRSLLSFFHLKELSILQSELGPIGGIYGILAGLDEESIYSLINREGTILTKDFLLARINYPTSLNILEYRFYLREELNNFLENTPYQLSKASHSKNCRYIDGPICWRYNVKHLFQVVNISSVTSFIGIFVILGIILWLLFTKIQHDKLEEVRRKLALQVLTHEFRTPVATLLLVMEKLNRNISKFDTETQEELLLLSTEIYRLQRLTEKSKHYLQGQTNEGLVKFSFERVNGLQEIVEEIVAPIELNYNASVNLIFKKVPEGLCIDQYWFQIIIKNLVENAFAHGTGQVSVVLDTQKDYFVVEVSDEGATEASLDNLTREFSKGNKSLGSGLGLSIVNRVIKEWGGKLQLIKSPTTFIASFPMTKKNKENV